MGRRAKGPALLLPALPSAERAPHRNHSFHNDGGVVDDSDDDDSLIAYSLASSPSAKQCGLGAASRRWTNGDDRLALARHLELLSPLPVATVAHPAMPRSPQNAKPKVSPTFRLAEFHRNISAPCRQVAVRFEAHARCRMSEAVSRLLDLITGGGGGDSYSSVSSPTWNRKLKAIVRQGEALLDAPNGGEKVAAVRNNPSGRTSGRVKMFIDTCEDLWLREAGVPQLADRLEESLSSSSSSMDDIIIMVRIVLYTTRRLQGQGQLSCSYQRRRMMISQWLRVIERVPPSHRSCAWLCHGVSNHLILHEDIQQTMFAAETLLTRAIYNKGLASFLGVFFSDDFRKVAASCPVAMCGALLRFLQSATASHGSPYDLLQLAASLAANSLQHSPKALRCLAERLNVRQLSSAAFPHLLLVAFLDRPDPNPEGTCSKLLDFLRCLAEARKLGQFCAVPKLTQGCEKELVAFCNACVADGSPADGPPVFDRIVSRCSACQQHSSPHAAIISPLIICHAGAAHRSPVQAEYLLLLTILALNTPAEDQDELAVPSWTDAWAFQRSPLTELHGLLAELRAYFLQNLPLQGDNRASIHADLQQHGLDLFGLVVDLLKTISAAASSWGLRTRVAKLMEAIQHVVSVDKDELSFLLSHRGRLDKYPGALEAVLDAFRSCTTGRGSRPDTWSTADIPGLIHYYYCFARYPQEDLQRWVLAGLEDVSAGEGVNVPSSSDVGAVFRNFAQARDSLHGRDEIASIGYNCVHHSQAFAVLMALRQADQGFNPFLKVGTGQGKSVIIALLAAHYAAKGRRVHVFTCYRHLARRDQARFSAFFDAMGFRSQLVSDSTDKYSDGVRIVYSDLSSFLDARSAQALERCKAPAGSEEWDLADHQGFYTIESNDVVILDEFDALILQHSQVGNTVRHIEEGFPVGHLSRESLTGAAAFKAELAQRHPDMDDQYWQLLSEDGFDDAIDDFLSGSHAWRQGSSGYDALGKYHHYIGGRAYELTQGRFYGKAIATDCLAFLSSSETVIGLSGSISAPEVSCFSELFGRQPAYVEVPPYYGPTESRNRQLANQRNLQTSDWMKSVISDAAAACRLGRPVLVFLHPESPEWQPMADELRLLVATSSSQQASSSHRGVFQEIRGEADMQGEALSLACLSGSVTLSSHVAGRGADFTVLNDVKRLGGLHVIIAFEPTQRTGREKRVDQRLVDQMKGRTGRMGAPGSHSIITTTAYIAHEIPQIECSQSQLDLHRVSASLFSALAARRDTTATQWKRYLFLSVFLDHMDSLPPPVQQVVTAVGYERARDHLLWRLILLCPLPPPPEPLAAAPAVRYRHWRSRWRHRHHPGPGGREAEETGRQAAQPGLSLPPLMSSWRLHHSQSPTNLNAALTCDRRLNRHRSH